MESNKKTQWNKQQLLDGYRMLAKLSMETIPRLENMAMDRWLIDTYVQQEKDSLEFYKEQIKKLRNEITEN